ncbi:hypothetical protein JXB12_04105 [candidate division KSB1 bacterium]|nr:hypothetical protein [candidate division KSB1 bacterium]
MFEQKANIRKLIIAILAAVTITSTHAQVDSFNWLTLDHPPFTIYYLEGDHKAAERVVNHLTVTYARISQDLEVTLSQPVRFYLCNSYDSYRKVVGINIPLWSTGLALPQQNTIVIKTVAAENNYLTTAVHELTHLIVHQLTNREHIPRWLNEGLAVYFSNEKDFASSTSISKALISNSIVPLSDIDHVLEFNPSKAQLAYQESYVAVILLQKRYGMNRIRQILEKIGEGYTVDEAFTHSIGIDSWEFELSWFKYIKDKYKWHFWVEFEFYLWILILFLFIFGFMIIRRRNKLKLQQWEEEDELDYLPDDYLDDTE